MSMDALEDDYDVGATSSVTMEVVDRDHFSGVLDVLQHARSGVLRTKTGIIEVRPQAGEPNGRRLFALELLPDEERGPIDVHALQILELELLFGDAVFSVEGSAVVRHADQLWVTRPQRLFSKGLAIMKVSPGRARLRWSVGRITIRTEVLELSIDEILVEGAGPSIVPGQPRAATIEFFEHVDDEPVEIEVLVDVRPGNPRPINARLVLSMDAFDRSELVRLYRLLRFPQLWDRGLLESRDVIDLFVRSHYLSLRDTNDSDPSEAWCCPDFASNVSIDTVYRADDGALLGHVSVTRAYSKTWLGHQLATLKGHPESAICRHALYRHFACAPLLSDGEECYLLGYYDQSVRWHQLFFESYVDWVGDPDDAVVVGFDRLEPISREALPSSAPADPQFDVGPLRPDEIRAAVSLVATNLPRLALRAMDIDAEHLVQDALHPDYKQLTVERGRYALALRRGDTVIGVALCETGSPHLSLFNLLNLGQIYVSRRHSVPRRAQAMLLGAVRRFYQERGTADPVLVAPAERLQHPEDVGLRCQETMGCIIWSGQSLLQYQSFISYCFAKIRTRSLTRSLPV